MLRFAQFKSDAAPRTFSLFWILRLSLPALLHFCIKWETNAKCIWLSAQKLRMQRGGGRYVLKAWNICANTWLFSSYVHNVIIALREMSKAIHHALWSRWKWLWTCKKNIKLQADIHFENPSLIAKHRRAPPMVFIELYSSKLRIDPSEADCSFRYCSRI